MTEPVRPQNNISFGGVQFNSNDIAKKEKIINEKGAIRYSVFLKNGVHLEYPKQKKTNDASVQMEYFEPPTRKNKSSQKRPLAETFIDNLAYGKIEGSKNNHDDIVLTGGNSNIIDISNDSEKDNVYIRPNVDKPSLNNQVVMDKKDRVDINRGKKLAWESDDIVHISHDNDVTVEGEGIADENSHKM